MESEHEIVPVQLAGGGKVYIEVPSEKSSSYEGRQNVGLKTLSFEDVTTTIKGLAQDISQALEAVKPQKAVVEFGLEIQAESGNLVALLVKGQGTATLKITLEWNSDSASS